MGNNIQLFVKIVLPFSLESGETVCICCIVDSLSVQFCCTSLVHYSVSLLLRVKQNTDITCPVLN